MGERTIRLMMKYLKGQMLLSQVRLYYGYAFYTALRVTHCHQRFQHYYVIYYP